MRTDRVLRVLAVTLVLSAMGRAQGTGRSDAAKSSSSQQDPWAAMAAFYRTFDIVFASGPSVPKWIGAQRWPLSSRPADFQFQHFSTYPRAQLGVSAASGFRLEPFSLPPATNDTWLGGPGSWSNGAMWSLGTAPNSTDNAVIGTSTPAAVVQLNVPGSINNLTIGSTSVLDFDDNTSLTVDGSSISNKGAMALNSQGDETNLIIGASNVTLSGGGTLTMSNYSRNYIYGSAAANTLTNQETIQGSGYIGDGSMALVNQGTINANQSTPLYIDTSNGTTNTGTLEATAGGNLILYGDTYTNAGGTILASGTGSVVTLQGSTVNGGAVNVTGAGSIQLDNATINAPVTNSSTGLIEATGGANAIGALTNPAGGQVTVNDNVSLALTGPVVNSGSIALSSQGDETNLIIGASNVTLSGGGTLTMSNYSRNYIYGSAAANTLTNQETIQGSGNIGDGSMALVNQGTIIANQSNSLYIDTSNGTTNTGTLEATAGGNLILYGDTYANAGGTILASGTGSVVTLQGSTINGGTLSTAGGGLIQAAGNPTLSGITNSGAYQIPDGNSTTLIGAIGNSGSIALSSQGDYTDLIIGASNVTLSGGGTLTMSNYSHNYIYGSAASNTLTNQETIQGSGYIGDGSMALVNQGTINANQSNSLYIDTSNGTTNTGTLEATAGGNLILYGDTYTNANGTILASGTGSVVTLQGSTINGGTLNVTGAGGILLDNATINAPVTNSSTGLIEATGGANTIAALTNPAGGQVTVIDGVSLALTAPVVNSGSIALSSQGDYTDLIIGASNVTLGGGGTLTMSNNSHNYIYGSAASNTLTNQETIQGSGYIGDGSMALVNQGTINANQSNSLYIDTSNGTTNTGTLEATAGGNLILYGDTYTNANGTILASGTGSVVTLQGSTINGGTLNVTGAGGILLDNATINAPVTNSSTGLIEATGGANTIAALTNPAGGQVTVIDGVSLALTAPVVNSGSIALSSQGDYTDLIIGASNVTLGGGGTLTMSNNSHNYIYGSAASNTLTNQETIQGSGYIGDGSMALVNQGTINANQSNSLYIDTSNGTTNTGTLEATAGGNLILYGDTYTNANGTILASGTGSVVTLQGSTINGGTLNVTGAGGILLDNATINAPVTNSSTGLIEATGGANTIAALTNPAGGQVTVIDGVSLALTAPVVNSGSIALSSQGDYTDLIIGASNVTLGGGGTLTMSNNSHNYIYGSAASNTLTNQETIQGSGYIGDGSMALVNQGTINANQSNSLYIDTSNGTTNTGTLEATAGGNLILYGDTYTNANGTILASGTGSVVTLQGSTINGGTLNVTGAGGILLDNATINAPVTNSSTGLIEATGGANTIAALTNPAGGQVTVIDGVSLALTAPVVNSGSIALSSQGDYTDLIIGASNVTLGGGGTLTMSNNSHNYIYGSAASNTLTNQETIQGSGNIGDGSMALVNQGTINANQSVPLDIDTSNGTTNTGKLEATARGNLILNSDTYTNTNGTILASGAGSLVTVEGSTINGGTLNTAGGGLIQASGSPTLNGVTNSGSYQIPDESSTTLIGTISNKGMIALNSQGDQTSLIIGSSGVTLSGGGTLTMSNNSQNYIYGSAATNTLTNQETIEGSGNIGDASMHFVNNGAVIANQSTSLIIDPSSSGFTNNGSLKVDAGDTLQITGGPFTNFTGTTLTGGTYYVAGTLEFGASGSKVVTNDANVTLAGTGAKLLNLGGGNLLGSFSKNASGGTFTLESAARFATAGAFTNAGNVDLEQASTLKVNGALTNSGTLSTNNANLGGGANTVTVTGTFTNNAGANVTIGTNGDTTDTAAVGLLANAGTVTVDKGAIFNLTAAGTDSNTGSVALSGGTFSIQSGGTFTNSGTLDAEQGGTLTVNGGLTNSGTLSTNNANLGGAPNTITVTGTLTNNAGATVTVGANNDTTDTAAVGLLANAGTVTVDKGAVFNLTATGADSNTGSIALSGGTMSIQSGGTFTNSGMLDAEQGGTLTVNGGLINSGTLSTNNANLGGGPNTIMITGTLTNNTGAAVTIGANNDTSDTAGVGLLANAGTVTVDKGATFNLTGAGADSNTGSIALSGGTFSIQSGGAFTNSGMLDAEQGGTLTVNGGLTNSGTLSTNNANLGGGANTINVTGKLTNNTGANFIIGANNDTGDTASVGLLANAGAITVGAGASLTLSSGATDTNSGTIAVTGTLDIKAATTLSGAGAITLTNGAISGLSAGPTLINNSIIQGSGTISNLGITNTGLLSANQTAPLIVLPATAGLNNTGTIQVSTGDTMQIGTSAGGALVNFANNTLTGGTYNLTGTLQFGASGTSIATNAANITLNGGGQIIDFANNNILAGFNNNASTGVFKLASGASLTTTGGNFTNAGLFTVGTGTTFTVGGTSFNFTQTAGTGTVNGTLTSTTLGMLELMGGSLDGVGTLGYNVVDASILTPGDSASATGKLTVADTYTQNSAGSLDIQINGATAGTKYDVLQVTKGATLGGTLNVALGAGFTPSVGEMFTILTASSVSDTFATVNGLAINSSEHFTVTYTGNSVVLTVVSGALPAPTLTYTQLKQHGSHEKGRDGLEAFSQTPSQLPLIAPGATTAGRVLAPQKLAFLRPAPGENGFRPVVQFASQPVSAPITSIFPGSAASGGIRLGSLAPRNVLNPANHMRFECGVDLKALLLTSPRKMLKALWAAPDSPHALTIGYMNYNGSH